MAPPFRCLHCDVCRLIQDAVDAGETPGRIGALIAQAVAEFACSTMVPAEHRAEFVTTFHQRLDREIAAIAIGPAVGHA